MEQLGRHRRVRHAAVGATGVAVAAGAAILGWYQTVHVYRSVAYCLGPEPLDLDAGGNFAATFELFARAAVYVVIISVVAVPLLVAAARRNTGRRLAGTVTAVILAAAVLFIADYATSDAIEFSARYYERQDRVAERCPDGRPPWWPRWLPRPSTF